MNIDDPKLTAYALEELNKAERAATANEVAASPAAQREVQEMQTMARLLRKEFAAEAEQLRHRENTDASKAPLSANLSDIRDDPWFWTRARPLAIAAVFAVFAVIGLAIFGSNKLREKEIAQADEQSIRFHRDRGQSKPRLKTLKIRSPPTPSFNGSSMTACCRQKIRCESRK